MVSVFTSQMVTAVELTVVELTQVQEVTQEEVDLWMKFGEVHAWHR